MSGKSLNYREARRRAKARYAEHQRACARARQTLFTSGWDIRESDGGNLVAERVALNSDGSSDHASMRTIYGRDELELLESAVKHEPAPFWHR